MTIITDLVQGLLESEFRIVGGLYDSKVIGDDTRYIALYKQVGTIMYAIGIINCDKEYDYRDKQVEIAKFFSGYYERLNVKSVLLTTLFITQGADEELIKYADMKNFDVESQLIEARWVVDRSSKAVIINGNQPKEVLNVNSIIKKSFKRDGAYHPGMTIEDLMKNNNEQRLKLIKSKNCFLTFALLAVNIIVLLVMEFCGGSENSEVLMKFGALYRKNVIEDGEYYRMFTNMFLHIGYLHLGANALSLLIFGMRVERYYGKIKMAIIYIVSGLCASLAVILTSEVLTAGASGAIFGLMGAILAYTLINKKSVDGFDIHFLLVFAIIGIGSGFVMEGVSNAGHIGGFIGGILVGLIMNKIGSKDKV